MNHNCFKYDLYSLKIHSIQETFIWLRWLNVGYKSFDCRPTMLATLSIFWPLYRKFQNNFLASHWSQLYLPFPFSFGFMFIFMIKFQQHREKFWWFICWIVNFIANPGKLYNKVPKKSKFQIISFVRKQSNYLIWVVTKPNCLWWCV